MNKKENVIKVGNSFGFLELLGLLFIGLKLAGIIDWSWWLVLLPIYGPLVLFLAFLLTMLVIMGGTALAVTLMERK